MYLITRLLGKSNFCSCIACSEAQGEARKRPTSQVPGGRVAYYDLRQAGG
jgi:hypothetical protein